LFGRSCQLLSSSGSSLAHKKDWQRQDRARPHDFVVNSQSTDGVTGQTSASSQPEAKPKTQPKTQPEAKQEEESGRRGSWVVAPLPISSPALGTGLVPVLADIFPFRKSAKISPPAVVGTAGLVTNNETRGFAAYGDLFLRADTCRITSIYVHGNLNYDL
jgi:hypothetical protein